MKARLGLVVLEAVAIAVGVQSCGGTNVELGRTLFRDTFDVVDGLVTNSWAHWNDEDHRAILDRDWRATSGTLYVRDGSGWTGRPDGGHPDAGSTTANGSGVFRLRTNREDFRDVQVDAVVRVERFISTPRTPPSDWDGVHLWFRYQSPQELYVVSVDRRDDVVVIKKKCLGGIENGGTYHTLGSVRRPAPLRKAFDVAASAINVDGGVELRVSIDDRFVLDAVDRGTGCSPITAAGAVGLRSDNVEVRFDDFTVREARLVS